MLNLVFLLALEVLHLKVSFHILLLSKVKNKLLFTFTAIILSACSVALEELSCELPEIDCYRYDYSSIDNFKNSLIQHSYKWNKKVPTHVLSHIVEHKKLFITSLRDAEKLIITNPNDIYVLGKYIEKQRKPREWLFVAEQAFLRSWNNSNR